MQPSAAQKEKIMDWLESMDRIGPFTSIDILQKSINDAPELAFIVPDYSYIQGLIVGRIVAATMKYSQSTIADMRQAAEAGKNPMQLGLCDGLEIGYGWI